MPHLLRFSRDIETRLQRLAQRTGLPKGELIERCLAVGMSDLETQLLLEDASSASFVVEPPALDQVLRESGLGA
ncbi:iron-containing alcohol dehydrogenase [Billgrantia pellis]|uniref:Iron-containing alcohol dehydrogenase n=1 Tax=Billgrantia pellis TaxID=2606936 RepID=A0A7V7G1Z5_9GAMM|nr:iron-containing alcohol dehydrogenase [Halomonas pellis]KAA0013561.1 iron-containing alcohol dehydrogenase [Halomonas pellis]